MCRQIHKTAALVLCLISIFWLAEAPCRAAESSGPTGTLRIDGVGVQRLRLLDGSAKSHVVEITDGVAELSPSAYTVTQIYLTNGLYTLTPKTLAVEVTADAEATLKVGGPLTQKIEAKRQGCMLVLPYSAIGIGGAQYAGILARSGPPTFDVYKGGRKIHHAKFEYG